jgi:hypothetical protein
MSPPPSPLDSYSGFASAHMYEFVVTKAQLVNEWALEPYTPVESEALVRAFSPGSTLELGLKAFRRRGPKWPGTPHTF